MRAGIPLLVGLLCLCATATGDEPSPEIGSYLYQPAYHIDDVLRLPAVPYLPQPGDVLLATDDNKFWWATHALAGAFEPHNSAIVVRRADGSMGILEAGPNDIPLVLISPMLPHLKEYADKGPVWIRKRKTPLTPEQCCALTEFAERQVGKKFALVRLAGQLTPFRSRGPLRTCITGGPHGDRCSYYCAELVLESCVYIGLCDPRTTRPCASYPHDLFYDHSFNPWIAHHLPLACGWEPPARWTYCP